MLDCPGWRGIVSLLLPVTMRDFSSIASFFAISCGLCMLVGASIIDIKPPAKDAVAYSKCIKLHPQRYCSITHLGAK